MPRLKTLIQGGPWGLDKNLSHWKFELLYAGNITHGMAKINSTHRGYNMARTVIGATPTPVPNQLPVGFHDGNTAACVVSGWATDPDDRSRDLSIKIYSDGALVKSDTANVSRTDLANAGVCPGGTCSFSTSLSGFITPNVSHSITVKAVDAQTNQEQTLTGTPKTITCSASSPSPTPTANPTPTPTPTTDPNQCGLITASHLVPDGFASPLDVVSDPTNNMMKASCSPSNAVSLSLGNGSQFTYIYRIGYIYIVVIGGNK